MIDRQRRTGRRARLTGISNLRRGAKVGGNGLFEKRARSIEVLGNLWKSAKGRRATGQRVGGVRSAGVPETAVGGKGTSWIKNMPDSCKRAGWGHLQKQQEMRQKPESKQA